MICRPSPYRTLFLLLKTIRSRWNRQNNHSRSAANLLIEKEFTMKKKLFCVTCLLLLQTAFITAPVYQPVQAAKGGIRMSAPRSAPAAPAPKATPKTNTNNNTSSAQSQTRNQSTAPRTNTNTTTNRSSAWGGPCAASASLPGACSSAVC